VTGRACYRLGMVVAVLQAISISPARAQVVEGRVGRFFASDQWMAYGVGFTRPLGGIFRMQVHGDVLRREGGAAGGLAGLGADLTALRRGNQGPYIVAGVSGGLGSETDNNLSTPWGAWSAGAGYDLFPTSFLSVGAEGRWKQLSLGGRKGLEIAIGLALHTGSGSRPSMPLPRLPIQSGASLDTEPAPQLAPAKLADSIVATATEVMGRRYEFGGTGAGGEGFDCSGLIQYAYGKHGIALPRRSVDQAREGRKIDRKLPKLAPADILTFSNRGGTVTHVGLYIGGGRFIHSASRGVQVSTLSAKDPYGRWWYKRWVGVRRVVR
jgi:hypothetical protein